MRPAKVLESAANNPDYLRPYDVDVWKVAVGRVTLYLINTDIEVNDAWYRGISARLYIADAEQRLRQEKEKHNGQ